MPGNWHVNQMSRIGDYFLVGTNSRGGLALSGLLEVRDERVW